MTLRKSSTTSPTTVKALEKLYEKSQAHIEAQVALKILVFMGQLTE
ncbi:hypothetical protein OVS_02155 [Mycoplasma ovis str. Michigan]|uniref:Uncharacterized protein n=1 Tax=Mycoplasma ovis str. Michigan TaxID=1415773 RepID=A0ABM5P1D5_9MOLU|nr:hypothetical protein [Mycoplasma ovis]AHC40292.1 hypothetical protein OVS_02155 [Mycoplasma ovis str. Michigan]